MSENAFEAAGIVAEQNVAITMRDGVTLRANLFRPAKSGALPALLLRIPYNKDAAQTYVYAHPAWYARHGYAVLVQDSRGRYASEGEFYPLRQDGEDGFDTIEWCAAQPWCDGKLGMMGISWGGFNGLQIAALQPPALKAVVSLASTDDRYADDVHYMGGAMVIDQLSWSAHMFAINTLPPDPALVGERWSEMWRERLEDQSLWLETWAAHQRRDAYWKHGSVCEDYGVWKEKQMYGKTYFGIERTTVLIAADGTIARIWPRVKVPGHAEEVLEAVKAL